MLQSPSLQERTKVVWYIATIILAISDASDAETNFLNIMNDVPNEQINITHLPRIWVPQATCGNTNLCGPGTACSQNEECVCIDSEDMTFDEETSSCLSFVGTACFLEPIVGVIKNCVENAYCDPANSLTGYCVCEDGFNPNPDRLCGIASLRPTARTTLISISTTETIIPTVESSSTDTSATDKPEIHPDGIIGQSCNIQRGRGCITNAICTDGYCICGQRYVHNEDYKSCLLSSSPKSHINIYQCLLFLFVITACKKVLS